MPKLQIKLLATVAAIVLWAVSTSSLAGDLRVTVLDQQRQPLALAVVSVEGPPASALQAQMDQVEQLFSPFVLTVPVGSTVSFPNSDNIRHQVYSFSSVKSFELPLYSNQEAPILNFATAGVVTLGCNIHDHMRAYIYVSPHQQSVTTDTDGQALITIADEGDSVVRVWYPRLGEQLTNEQRLTVTAGQQQLEVQLAVSPDAQQRPALSPLQQRFNKRKTSND